MTAEGEAAVVFPAFHWWTIHAAALRCFSYREYRFHPHMAIFYPERTTCKAILRAEAEY
jgi:hypothetical protein